MLARDVLPRVEIGKVPYEQVHSWLEVHDPVRAYSVELLPPGDGEDVLPRRHNLLELFDALDQSIRACIEQQYASSQPSWVSESVRSILDGHKDDFTVWRYLGQKYRPDTVKQYVYGGDLDAALRALITAFHEIGTKASPDQPV